MNESQRREWLGTLLTPQLCALCYVAGIHNISTVYGDRQAMINNLCLVEGIEIPKETS